LIAMSRRTDGRFR